MALLLKFSAVATLSPNAAAVAETNRSADEIVETEKRNRSNEGKPTIYTSFM